MPVRTPRAMRPGTFSVTVTPSLWRRWTRVSDWRMLSHLLFDDDEVDGVEPNETGPLLGGADGRPSSLSLSFAVVTVDSTSPPEPRAFDKSYSVMTSTSTGFSLYLAALFLLLRQICKRLCEQGSGDQTTSQDERPVRLTMTHEIPPRRGRLGGRFAGGRQSVLKSVSFSSGWGT